MSTITTSQPSAVARCKPLPRRDDRVGRFGAVHGHLELPSELLELVDRGGALKIGGDEPGRLPFALSQVERELGRGGGLARALEAAEEDHDGRSAEDELRVARAHELGELLVDDLDDLLTGLEPLEHVLAGGPLAHGGDELLDDLEVDVGLEQGEADLARRARDGLLVEAGLAPEVAESVLEPVRERVEHGLSAYPAPGHALFGHRPRALDSSGVGM